MQNILVLGHNGMLGNAVYTYLSTKKDSFVVLTTNERWDTDAFKNALAKSDAEAIINCIGTIPQKKPSISDYQKTNIDLPIFLETLGKKIIHPSTDCEFSGSITKDKKYSKQDIRDTSDDYGKSKAMISDLIESTFQNTKIIRTSIIGHEEHSHLALLDWFLHSEGVVHGYTNRYWNGITTLQWAKLCVDILANWDTYPTLNQFGTKVVESKFVLLNTVKDVYQKNTIITPLESEKTENKCLESDVILPSIKEQLQELRVFYTK